MLKAQDILKSKGIRVTPQRMAVFQVLEKAGCHLSVDAVYEEVKKTIPNISLATVYSILEFFRDKSMLTEIKIDFEKSFYEFRTDAHHHFMCTECKQILDIDIPFCGTLCAKSVEGHKITDFQGYFYGICKKCQK